MEYQNNDLGKRFNAPLNDPKCDNNSFDHRQYHSPTQGSAGSRVPHLNSTFPGYHSQQFASTSSPPLFTSNPEENTLMHQIPMSSDGVFAPASSCVGSPPVASFYAAAEQAMGFPGFDCLPPISQLPRFSLESSRSIRTPPGQLYSQNSAAGDVPFRQSNDTLDSAFNYPLPNSKFAWRDDQEYELDVYAESLQAAQRPAMDVGHCPSPLAVSRTLFEEPRFLPETEKSLPGDLSTVPGVNSTILPGAAVPKKTRIRWTQDLHEKFVECANRLGGAEKATPKGILNLMNTEGLTINHVKSHLQKYRMAKYMPASAEGNLERRTLVNNSQQLDFKSSVQITETLRVQLDLQRHLHEQLEMQRNLQLRMEVHERKLQEMFELQLKANKDLLQPDNNLDTDDYS